MFNESTLFRLNYDNGINMRHTHCIEWVRGTHKICPVATFTGFRMQFAWKWNDITNEQKKECEDKSNGPILRYPWVFLYVHKCLWLFIFPQILFANPKRAIMCVISANIWIISPFSQSSIFLGWYIINSFPFSLFQRMSTVFWVNVCWAKWWKLQGNRGSKAKCTGISVFFS